MLDFDYKSIMILIGKDEHLVRSNLSWWQRRQCSCHPTSRGGECSYFCALWRKF